MKEEKTELVSSDKPEGGFDIYKIMEKLPHRYPFLLVDRVTELEDGKRIVGIKNVTINEPFFQGHFPARPVMPGVLILEALAQLSGIILLTRPENKDRIGYFLAIDRARFRRAVLPGDQLRLMSDVIRMKSRFLKVRVRALVGEELACEAEMMFQLMD